MSGACRKIVLDTLDFAVSMVSSLLYLLILMNTINMKPMSTYWKFRIKPMKKGITFKFHQIHEP